jgi:hypothetical protein
MPQYMLLIYNPTATPEQLAEEHPKWGAYTQELRDAGVFVNGDALQGVELATTARERDGELQLTDGPFAETREQLGGYYTIEVPTLDKALEYAGRAPSIGRGSIEVRPVWDMSELMRLTGQVEASA